MYECKPDRAKNYIDLIHNKRHLGISLYFILIISAIKIYVAIFKSDLWRTNAKLKQVTVENIFNLIYCQWKNVPHNNDILMFIKFPQILYPIKSNSWLTFFFPGRDTFTDGFAYENEG